MKRLIFILLVTIPFAGISQQKFNLRNLLENGKVKVYNRTATLSDDASKEAIYLTEAAGEGIAWLNGVNFSEGTIEVDLKGKDEYQKSFIGIAFHGQNDSTYDAVYFRPFNFRTTDSVRHIHAVQYISHPQYPWKKLRDEQNAKYEKEVNPAPDPNQWFHARIVVKNDQVAVYVDGAQKPSLTVQKLNKNKNGAIGLWVGDGAGGTFANLSITQK